MKAIMGIAKGIASIPSAGAANLSAATAAGTSRALDSLATGGVTPQIKSFRSFSKGGMTGSPTLALLGDNASKKELVIPSEQISKDSVSGYARDREEKQAINVINILTQDDIANAMAQTAGSRVIINTIGQDLNKRGTIYKQMRV